MTSKDDYTFTNKYKEFMYDRIEMAVLNGRLPLPSECKNDWEILARNMLLDESLIYNWINEDGFGDSHFVGCAGDDPYALLRSLGSNFKKILDFVDVDPYELLLNPANKLIMIGFASRYYFERVFDELMEELRKNKYQKINDMEEKRRKWCGY